MLKFAVYTSLTIDVNLKLQRLLENNAIVGRLFCFVRDIDNTYLYLLWLLKKVNFQSRCLSHAVFENLASSIRTEVLLLRQ